MVNDSEKVTNDKVNKEIIQSFTNEILKSNSTVCTIGDLHSCAQEVLKERNDEFQKIMRMEIIKIFNKLKGQPAENLLQQFNDTNFKLNKDFLTDLSSLISSQKLTGFDLDRTAEQAKIRADEVLYEIILKKLRKESQKIDSGLDRYLSKQFKNGNHLSRNRYHDIVFSLYQLMKINNVKVIVKNMEDEEFAELLHAIDKRIQFSYDLLEQGTDPNIFIERKNYYEKHYRSFAQTVIAKVYETDIVQKIMAFSKSPLQSLRKYMSSYFKSSDKKDSSARNEFQVLSSNLIPQPLTSVIPNIPNTPISFLQLFFMNQLTIFIVSVNSVGLFVGLGFGLFPPVAMYTFYISVIKNTHDLISYDTEKPGGMHDYTATKNVQIICKDDQKRLSTVVTEVNSQSISENSSQLQK